MRVLITGGAGFIGSHIVEQLLEQNHEVFVLDNLSTGKRENLPTDIPLYHVDVRDAEAVDRVFAEVRPDAVSHQAAQASVAVSVKEPFVDAQTNIVGTLNVLNACVRHLVGRVVYASTGGALYGEVPEGQAATTSWLERPLSPYGCSKLAGEHYVRSFSQLHGFSETIVRYANVYGPRQDPHGEAGVVAIFARRIFANEPLQINARAVKGDGGCVRDYVYVGDVARINCLALQGRLPASLVNVGTGRSTTTEALAKQMMEVARMDVPLVQAEKRLGDLERSVLEFDPHALGTATELATGLQKTLAWFRV